MKSTNVMTSMLLSVAIAAGLAPGASAQEGPPLPRTEGILSAAVAEVGSEPGPNQFGSEWFTKMIPLTEFVPYGSSSTFSIRASGYASVTGGSTFWAPLGLPPGTEIQRVCLFTYDNSTIGFATLRWGAHLLGDSNQQPKWFQYGEANTQNAGTPGYGTICVVPVSPVPIRAYADVDGDGDSEYNSHFVIAGTTQDSETAWGGAYVVWRRAMSPAPATATFPNDVPTSHPFFRYVEALYASGITAGCGTGYCPDNPVTRGQMAVFLTKALGLYWPY